MLLVLVGIPSLLLNTQKKLIQENVALVSSEDSGCLLQGWRLVKPLKSTQNSDGHARDYYDK